MDETKILEGKKILLLYARFFGYDKIVKAKLEEMGAQVDLYDARAEIKTFEKAFLKVNPTIYYKKQKDFHHKICVDNSNKRYDFIYTNEHITDDALKEYKETFPDATMILYLDDSAENLRHIETTFPLYDRILTFDSDDAKQFNIPFRALFFCDTFRNRKTTDRYDICFIGTCHSDRLNVINKAVDQDLENSSFLYCYLQSKYMYDYYRTTNPAFRLRKRDFFKYKAIPQEEVAEKMSQSKAILDIQHPRQTGLTMRTIETLGLEKKIITTNANIKEYDFYNSNNVLVIDRENPVIPKEFLEKEYIPIDRDMYERYSIEGWINEIFVKENTNHRR